MEIIKVKCGNALLKDFETFLMEKFGKETAMPELEAKYLADQLVRILFEHQPEEVKE